MRRNSLAIIDTSDEYIQALLSPLYEELGLDEPMDEEELLAIDQYSTRDRERIGISYSKPSWADLEDSNDD